MVVIGGEEKLVYLLSIIIDSSTDWLMHLRDDGIRSQESLMAEPRICYSTVRAIAL